MNNVTTFLKNRRKAQLLNKLSNLEKLSASYLESLESCSNLMRSNYTEPCCPCNFQACYFNNFLDNTYFSDMFYSNYTYFEYMYHSTEKRIKKIKKKLKRL